LSVNIFLVVAMFGLLCVALILFRADEFDDDDGDDNDYDDLSL